ncbi:MAG: hypothetical protein M1815_000228 [Lichina confinis]|nr:MAG: hypothetical protein M1815_000228 [Lichina confinis]
MGQAFIGDVFILSQLAVRVGRAFAACPAGTPEDFAEVDNQIKALTIQLDALADALEVDAIAVTSAKDKTRAEIARVLQSCRQTLLDLDCFLAQQHEVGRSAPTSEGADESTERSWKEALVDNWKPARWARDGGSVKTLRNMLQIHTRSVSMTMHAVKSKSVLQLDSTVAGLATQVDEVQVLAKDLKNTKLYETKALPALPAGALPLPPSVLNASPDRRPKPRAKRTKREWTAVQQASNRPGSFEGRAPSSPQPQEHALHDALSSQPAPLVSDPSGQPTSSVSTSGPTTSRPLDGVKLGGLSGTDALDAISPSTDDAEGLVPKGLRVRKPQPQPKPQPPQQQQQQQQPRSRNPSTSTFSSGLGSATTEPDATIKRKLSLASFRRGRSSTANDCDGLRSSSDSVLARPLLSLHRLVRPTASDPSQPKPEHDADRSPIHARLAGRWGREQLPRRRDSTKPAAERCRRRPVYALASMEQQTAFERGLWHDAAPLCEVSCKRVEYAEWDSKAKDYRLRTVAARCQVCLVQRAEELPDGGTRNTTSIWALSDDRQVRLQQKLHDPEAILPHTVWGTTNKVSLPVKCELLFHDTDFGASPLGKVETSWVNYVLEDAAASSMFQTALTGKTLLLTAKTHVTSGFFKDVAGHDTLEAQLCGLENLRLWQDPETKAVQAMVRYTADFKDNYLTFYLNSTRQPIHMQAESHRAVRLGGLTVPLEPTAESLLTRRAQSATALARPTRHRCFLPERTSIRAVQIVFSSELDKALFSTALEEAQMFCFDG